MTVTPVTSLAQFQEITNSGRPVVFDFWATWCGPCRFIGPIFEALSEQFTSVEFYKVDVDEHPDISQEVGVRAMPTFIGFKNGEKQEPVIGASRENLQSLIAQLQA